MLLQKIPDTDKFFQFKFLASFLRNKVVWKECMLKSYSVVSLCMAKFVEMDESVTLKDQMAEDNETGPVILINKFNVKPNDVQQFLKAWEAHDS